jgi:hypothetical protein
VKRVKKIALLALLGGCLVAAGCGADEEEGAPIPAQQAQELESRLAEMERRFEVGVGACADIQNDSKPGVDQILATLPNGVDADLRTALQEGFDRLFSLSEEQCEAEAESEPETTPAEPPPDTDTETDTTETEPFPTETETTPTDTTEEPTTPTTPTEEPSEEEDPGDQGGGILAPGGDDG